MAEFKSWRSFWDFEEAIKKRMRYIHDEETNNFLEAVRATAERRVETIPKGQSLWRAQLGVIWRPEYEGDEWVGETPWPHKKDRMKPLSDQATEGRANSKGIPCLYLASDVNTAIAEVRPWVGSCVSVGRFRTNRELRLVICVTSDDTLHHVWFEKPPVEKREEAVWGYLDKAFARPVTPDTNLADYAPTQTVAELFKVQGYDGIAYRSSVNDTGYNIVLFDLDAAEAVEGRPFRVDKIRFEASPIENPVKYK